MMKNAIPILKVRTTIRTPGVQDKKVSPEGAG